VVKVELLTICREDGKRMKWNCSFLDA